MNTLNHSCKFCGKPFQNKQALAGHQTFCKCNPNYSKNKNKAIHTNSLKFQKIQYEIMCPKCGKIHVEEMTKECFEKGKYKTCTRCGQIKLAHNKYFSKNKTSKDGFYSICKCCRNSKDKKS